MKITAIFFFLLFFTSGGYLTSSLYDFSFMNYTICHVENNINKPEKSGMDIMEGEINVERHKHLEIHVIKVIPHLLHGDRLICQKNHKH